ncbi:nuclear transport factor 2 family protein [Sphingobacterium olei]|uniref:Nuclear transport factor 2 family protein n=1 Tax=Sphingobacterium olei TaxID=2571155 RepID=A0A4U0NGS0_9SPHI|nr:nuclear transport factor 2 family protein [Sphingobacterium olei]TJZ53349.1 nuclear transport factor 2 family protein [Sphingobacterium olei]
MKNIISTIATALILISSFSSFAAERANPLKNMNSKGIIAVYLDAAALGNTEFNQHLFAKDFEYYNSANEGKHSKKAYTKFLKQNKGLQYNCKTTYQILDESGNSCVAKATMEFVDFTRVDHITLCQTKDGWQVSKVVTTYP